MREKRPILALIVILLVVAGGTGAISLVVLYQVAFEQQGERLREIAQGRARLIEAIIRHDAEIAPAIVDEHLLHDPTASALAQIREGHAHFAGFGRTGEFTLAQREGEAIVFLLRHRHEDKEMPRPVLFSSELAEPMQRALSGQSGTIVGLDYRGVYVLAAHEPVEHGLGIVAKIDLAEVRAPFIRAGILSGLGASVLILIGTVLFLRIGNPIVQRLSAQARDLQREIAERRDTENALWHKQQDLGYRNRIAQILLSVPDEAMYDDALQVLLEATGSEWGFFGYIDQADGALVCPSMTRGVWERCEVAEKTVRFPRDQWGGLWGRALVERRSFLSNKPGVVPAGHIPITRSLVVPIIDHDELIGQIAVANKSADYQERDARLLEDLAAYLAPVLHARLQRDREERMRSQAEEQLRHAQKMEAIGQLAGGVAHDFNNVLTAILGYAELTFRALEQSSPSPHESLRHLEQIVRAAHRAATLTRQLLMFSRRQVLQPEVLDLNVLVSDVEKMLNRLLRDDIQLEIDPTPEIPCIHADPGQIEQIIMNLVVNAQDAMPDGGRITIETGQVVLEEADVIGHESARPGPHVVLSVTDTGCGMDQETIERIFEPFFTTKPLGEGTGLGLATVYGIVEHAGGHVCVYSEPGRGATFKIFLPAAEAAAAKPHAPADMPPRGGAETILVCENEAAIRDLMQRLLTDAGYTVLLAADGAAALKLAAEHAGAVRLLVTDVIMSGMSGRKLADQLPALRTLFVSGYPSNVLAHHGVLREGVAFLQKPFTRHSLLRRVREVLDAPRTSAAASRSFGDGKVDEASAV